MIAIEINDNTRELLEAFGVTLEQVEAVVNNPGRGVVDPGVNRLIAVSWNGENEAVLVDSTVTAKRVEGNQAVIERVRVMLALKLESSLPGGRIGKDSELEPLMLVVAESFGQPISFHRRAVPVVLYSGPWEENYVNIGGGETGQNVLVLATASPATGSIFAGWAFNLNKYMAWLRRNQIEEPVQITHHDLWKPPEDNSLINFSGEFASESLRKFGIKNQQALEAVNAPDRTDQLEFYGFIVRLHFKTLGTQPPSSLLVIESVKDGNRTVDFAFRVYPQLGNEVLNLRPLEILRMLTNNFGLLIKVGNQTGKLIVGERFDFSGDLVQGLEQPRGALIQQLYFKVDKGPLPKAYCPLAYCIETDLYSDWLKAMARKVN